MKNTQDRCIGTYMAVWFAAFLSITYIWHFSPCYLPQTPHPLLSYPYFSLTDPSVWWSPPCVHVFSLFNTYLWVRKCSVYFMFLCQFAENDGFQVHPCPYKGHELIIFYGCLVFHGVFVPHFLCLVYHRWAFGLVSALFYCKQCCNEHLCACVLIVEQFIILWIYTQ